MAVARHRGRNARGRRRGRRVGLAREAGPHGARLPDDRVRPCPEAEEASAQGAVRRALADVRLQRRTVALRAVPASAAVRGPLVAQAGGRSRASSGGRLRPRFPLQQPGHRGRHRRAARENRLEAAVPELHRRLPRGCARDALRPPDAPPAVREERSCHAGRDDRGTRRQDRPHEMAVQGRPDRVRPLARRPRPLLRLVGSQGLCAQRAQEEESHDLELRDRRQGRRRSGVRKRDCLRGHERGPRLRDQRAHRTTALAGAVVLALRPSGVLLRCPRGCLRPRLPRQHGWNGLRLRGDHREPALGSPGRDLRLLGTRRLEEHGVRWDVGRVLLGPRRANRRLPLALQRARRSHGGAVSPGRPRLLRDVRPVLAAAPEAREERPPSDLCIERAHRRSRLALPRRPLLAGRGRLPADLHLRKEAHLRSDPGGPPQADSALAGDRALRPIPESKKASAMPVKGQTRYELWKTRLRKSSKNIEIENPAAPAQKVPARL